MKMRAITLLTTVSNNKVLIILLIDKLNLLMSNTKIINMKIIKLSNYFTLLCMFLCLNTSIDLIKAQSIKKNKKKPQVVLNVISDKSNTSVIFEFTLIKKGKKIKIQKHKTPFNKVFNEQNMIFSLKKISGKSNIICKVTNIDRLNRELGSSMSTDQNVKFNIVGKNVNLIKCK